MGLFPNGSYLASLDRSRQGLIRVNEIVFPFDVYLDMPKMVMYKTMYMFVFGRCGYGSDGP
jgi:hypothetical protein